MRQAVPATTASGGSGRRYYSGTIRFARIRIQRMLNFDKACQTMRIIRERTDLATGKTTTETVYALTLVSAERADPEQLLAWNRGHSSARGR